MWRKTFGNRDSSSRMLSTPIGLSNMSMQFWRTTVFHQRLIMSLHLQVHSKVHHGPLDSLSHVFFLVGGSLTTSVSVNLTCSKTNMWWLKNCWSFSLQKLIASCSNPLKSKISKPAMSRTPLVDWFCLSLALVSSSLRTNKHRCNNTCVSFKNAHRAGTNKHICFFHIWSNSTYGKD